MKKLLSIALSILLCSIILVSPVWATETDAKYDWDNMDWENFSFKNYRFPELGTLWPWLREQEDLHIIFLVASRADGAAADSVLTILSDKFEQAPSTFIHALAQEEDYIQDRVLTFMINGIEYRLDEFAVFLSQLKLPETATEEEVNLVYAFVTRTEDRYNISITNPHTGDPVVFMAAGLVLSGFGGVLLLNKKKKES